MKKYLIFSISLVFILSIMACKPKQDPITLAARAGAYEAVSTVSTMQIVIGVDGSVTIDTEAYTKLNPTSTDTKFTVRRGDTSNIWQFLINFENNTVTSVGTQVNGRVYTLVKK